MSIAIAQSNMQNGTRINVNSTQLNPGLVSKTRILNNFHACA